VKQGLSFGDAAWQAIAHSYLIIVGTHGTQLKLYIFNVSEKSACHRKGIQVIGAEQTTAVADCTNGQLVGRLTPGQPFTHEGSHVESLVFSLHRQPL